MYLTPENFEYMGEDEVEKPTISCEYSYSIGNSNGGFNLIWKVFNKYPNVQGGFVWDWVDKGLLETGKNGQKYWAYGGDYGKKCPSNGNRCINGLVSPDRTPHPAMAEIKYGQQNIGFDAVNIRTST